MQPRSQASWIVRHCTRSPAQVAPIRSRSIAARVSWAVWPEQGDRAEGRLVVDVGQGDREGLAQRLGHRLQLGQRVAPPGPGVGQGARLVLPARPAVDREQEQPVVVLEQRAGPVGLHPYAGPLGQPGAAPGGLGQLRPRRVGAAGQVDHVGAPGEQSVLRPPRRGRPGRSRQRVGPDARSAARRCAAGRRGRRRRPRRRGRGRPGRPSPSWSGRTAASRPGRPARCGGPAAARTRDRRRAGRAGWRRRTARRRTARPPTPGRARAAPPGRRRARPATRRAGAGEITVSTSGHFLPVGRPAVLDAPGLPPQPGAQPLPGSADRHAAAGQGVGQPVGRRSRRSPSPGPGRTSRHRPG